MAPPLEEEFAAQRESFLLLASDGEQVAIVSDLPIHDAMCFLIEAVAKLAQAADRELKDAKAHPRH